MLVCVSTHGRHLTEPNIQDFRESIKEERRQMQCCYSGK